MSFTQKAADGTNVSGSKAHQTLAEEGCKLICTLSLGPGSRSSPASFVVINHGLFELCVYGRVSAQYALLLNYFPSQFHSGSNVSL